MGCYKYVGLRGKKTQLFFFGFTRYAVKLNARQAQAWFGLAEVGYARDDYTGAKASLTRYTALVPNPTDPIPYTNRAAAYLKLEKWVV